MIDFALIAALGLLDRLRGWGDSPIPPFIAKALMGLVLAGIVNSPSPWASGLVILGMILGSSIGWGNAAIRAFQGEKPTADYEWWQVWILREDEWAATVFRGLMWGACFLPAAIFDSKALYPAIGYAISFPLCIFLVSITTKKWPHQEYLRSWVAGLFTWGLV